MTHIMYKYLFLVALIFLFAQELRANETHTSDAVVEFAGNLSLSESVLSSPWVKQITAGNEVSSDENTVSTCCFGCPDPTVLERNASGFCLPLFYETKIVTKTKERFSIKSKNGVSYLYVPENTFNTWFNVI